MAFGIMTKIMLSMEAQNKNNRIFVHVKYDHYKYYIVDTETSIVKYGRIGAVATIHEGYTKIAALRKISEKLRKGYEEITGDAAALARYGLDKYE